jgi:hypothetical protein
VVIQKRSAEGIGGSPCGRFKVRRAQVKLTEEHIEALELFNEKARKLASSAFVEALLSSKTEAAISGRRQENGSFEISAELRGPSSEAVDAFVLTLRFFIQDNETASLRNIAAIYDEIGDDDDKFLSRFNSARSAINQLLDSPNLTRITFNNSRPTNRDVMQTFIYGGLAHANRKKSKVFKAWMEWPPVGVLFSLCFTSVLAQVLQAITFVRDLNKEILLKLKSR